MRPVTLVLIVHDHQPVGNFDGVIAEAYEQAYAPFLAFLEAHPQLRLALHTSGPLLLWLAEHRPDYLARLRALVARGQVEPWGGGFFEPVLPAIPEIDRRGQILAAAEWLERELGTRPLGLWLTERAWEPGLASSLAAAGVEYVAVDDAHFVAAGFERDQLWGVFRTEDQGLPLTVLPIHRELRYLIPFGDPAEVVSLLARVGDQGEGRIAVLGDDGEKFGVWPGTHARCYEQGWLERFSDALEAHPWITLRTPAEAVQHHAPRGLAYLPTAAYHELQEWALPPQAQARYHQAAAQLKDRFGDGAHDLLRGGHWRNFLARYPESNRMHKRMLRASRRLQDRPHPEDRAWTEARTHLWRAQCNDAYWHGIFGGLYLPHLREGVYRELIAAETFVAESAPRTECADFDLDGAPDVLIESRTLAAWISSRGGRLWALDDRARRWAIGDTLARRPEYYHAALAEAAVGGDAEGKTIHGAVRLKDPGALELVGSYDRTERDSFLDRWEDSGTKHEWWNSPFDIRETGPGEVSLGAAEGAAPALEKRFRLDSEALVVEYSLSSARGRTGRFTVEVNLGLHVPEAADRYVEVNAVRATPPHFAARACHEAVTCAAFVDRWAERRLVITHEPAAVLSRAPIETVSLSESGAERVFQGLELLYRFEVTLAPGRPFRARFRLQPGPAREHA